MIYSSFCPRETEHQTEDVSPDIRGGTRAQVRLGWTASPHDGSVWEVLEVDSVLAGEHGWWMNPDRRGGTLDEMRAFDDWWGAIDPPGWTVHHEQVRRDHEFLLMFVRVA